MKKSSSINKLLYEARIKKGESIRIAALLLNISRLHLKLIEQGYLNVSDKLKPIFISHYKLNKNFFEINSTYIEEINPIKPENEFHEGLAKKFDKKPITIISLLLVLVSIFFLVFGTYCSNRQYRNPRESWTSSFTTLVENVREYGKKSESIVLLDSIYTISGEEIETKESKSGHLVKSTSDITVYGKDYNSSSISINSVNKIRDEESTYLYTVTFNIYCYNNKKIIYSSCSCDDKTLLDGVNVEQALGLVDSEGNYTLQPFNYTIGAKYYKAQIGSDVYNRFYDIFSRYVTVTYDSFNIGLLEKEAALGHDLGYTNIIDIINDLQKVSKHYVSNFRFGIFSRIFAGISLVIFLLLFGISVYSHYLIKNKHKVKSNVGELQTYSVFGKTTGKREIPNDIAISPVLPEFSLKGLGLIVLFLASFALYGSVYILLHKSFLGLTDLTTLKKFTSTYLVAGTTLLFFIKLDVYSKKTLKALLINISLLFLGGLAYYIIEVSLYSAIQRTGDIFSVLLQIITNILPGNIIWNLMLYSCIFLFLFTTPKKIENNPSKILLYRLCSFFPTFILIFAFIYKSFLEQQLPSPYWFSFMFFTKGIVITLFAIFYMYLLYFYKLYCTLKHGINDSKIYFNSRKFAFYKNGIACVVLLVLGIMDLLFKFYYPSNTFGLGNNYAILVLIPFIFFYRPHIGERNKVWDTAYIITYIICFAWGYIAVFSTVLSYLDLSDLIIVLF